MLPPLVRRSFGQQTLEQEQTLEQQAGPPCSIGSCARCAHFPRCEKDVASVSENCEARIPKAARPWRRGSTPPSEIGHHVTRRTDPVRDGLAWGLDAMDERYERRRGRCTHHGYANPGGS